MPPPIINIVSGNDTKLSNRKEKLDAPKLETRLKSVSKLGLATVTFSQEMRIPANISSIDAKVMNIKVIPSPDSDPKYLKIIKWKVTSKFTFYYFLEFTKRSMEIDIAFENPLRISSTSVRFIC